ncbi:ATPase [Methylopila jiangsuensis]|uniref:ATPase n=1 Tax=Methylopila jiangsuensis TaxID=586230 RepID=A0A9W6JGK4_9HYPH|nr:ATP12 family protein [Methylopila jiangsuensis]MDR6286113.1 chaperone required for assembly of F1-ATPase [Methylopila jiangsuensis]GLK75873.1 ATPase [Methylopila jiangsuensis]
MAGATEQPGFGDRPAAPKRFYKAAEALERDGLFVIALDGRVARTPGREPLAFARRALAEAVAAEWSAQGEFIEAATMPLTRLANAAIDGVAREAAAVAEDVVNYAGSDLVCYRAEEPPRLVARQALHWDPVLAFARDDLGARFVLAEGVMFVTQSDDALEAVRRATPRDDAFTLAALHAMTTLTGSALIALAVLRGGLTPDAAWAAAHVDEDWNAELWGADHEAEQRRARRWAEMRAAAFMMGVAGD